jgi:hypothetical protein
VTEGQSRRIPIALPRSLDDVLAWQQLRARGAWRTMMIDSTAVDAPRLPLLEPGDWRETTQVSGADVVTKWRSS